MIDATSERALLHSDCRAIGEAQRRFETALRSGEARVTTAAGTDLRFRIGDRPVNLQDGDASAVRAGRDAAGTPPSYVRSPHIGYDFDNAVSTKRDQR